MRISPASQSWGRRDPVARSWRLAKIAGVWASAASGMASAAPEPATDAQQAPSRDATSNKLREVVVTGVRPLLGDKIPLTVQDTPQSVNVVPQTLLREQAVTRLEDALKNVPGVTLNAGEGAARGDTINIRGFSAFNDFFLDGIRDAAVYTRDTFDVQSVEVLKGPSATLFGRGSTGGAVNQVSKAPALEGFGDLTAQFGTNDSEREVLDIDRPFGAEAAARLSVMGESSHVADRDLVKNTRWGVAPVVAFGIGRPTTLTLAYMHLQELDVPDVGIPFLFGAPADVPRNLDYGLALDRAVSHVDVATVRLTHDLGPGLTLADTFRAARYQYDYQFDSPNFGDDVPSPGTPLDQIFVGRDAPSSSGVQTNLTDQLDLTARFVTGPLHHTLVTGIELARQTNDLERYLNPFDDDPAWIPPTPLLNPDPFQSKPPTPVTMLQKTTADSEAAYVTDTMDLRRWLDVIAGVRVDRFAADYVQANLATGGALDLNHVDVVASPRVAVVFKPTARQSLYVSYGTSFDPSAEALTLTTRTANLGPVKATTLEGGVKSSWLNGGLLLTGAVFHTEVDNAQINDPNQPGVTVLQGNETVRGFELGANGHVTPRLEVAAGYTHLVGSTSRAGFGGPFTNVAIPNLAHDAVNLWAEYDLTDRWEVGGGLNYLGQRAADIVTPSNPLAVVPSYLVWNAMTSYKLNKRLSVQLNALNLFDTVFFDAFYYTSAAENHAVPGPGRTVKLTLRAKF